MVCVHSQPNRNFPYLVALEDGLPVRNLMLLQTVGLVKALEAVFALELWLMRNVVGVVARRVRIRPGFSFLWLRFDLRVLGLFMILQVLFRAKSLIAVRAIEDVVRGDAFLFDFDVQSHRIGLKICNKIHLRGLSLFFVHPQFVNRFTA